MGRKYVTDNYGGSTTLLVKTHMTSGEDSDVSLRCCDFYFFSSDYEFMTYTQEENFTSYIRKGNSAKHLKGNCA